MISYVIVSRWLVKLPLTLLLTCIYRGGRVHYVGSTKHTHTHTHTHIYIYIYHIHQGMLTARSPLTRYCHQSKLVTALTAWSVSNKLVNESFYCSIKTGESMCRSLSEKIAYESFFISPAVANISCSYYFDCLWDGG